MLPRSYFHLRAPKHQLWRGCVLCAAWTFVIYSCLMSIQSGHSIGILRLVLITLQNQHQELYFLLPFSVGAWLLYFRRPSAQELWFLADQNKFIQFLIVYILRLLVIYVVAIVLASSLILTQSPTVFLDSANVPLALVLMTGHLLGVTLSWFALGVVINVWKPLVAVIGYAAFILGDHYLFTKVNWSIFLTNGLTVPVNQYGLNVITNLFLYIFYAGVMIRTVQPLLKSRGALR